MLTMAIEAIRQHYSENVPIVGYRFKDVVFQNAVKVDDSPYGTEMQLTLHPVPSPVTSDRSAWNEFRIYTYDNKMWSQSCKGFIAAEQANVAWIPSGVNEHEEHYKTCITSINQSRTTCFILLTKNNVYQAFEKIGLKYGSTFQGLENVYVDDNGTAVGIVDLQHGTSGNAKKKFKQHLIHPTALDSIFQLAFPALAGSSLDKIGTMVPTNIQELWISNDINKSSDHSRVDACATSRAIGMREVQTSINARDVRSGKIVLTLDFTLTAIDSVQYNKTPERDISRRFYTLEYSPDVALIDRAEQLACPSPDQLEPGVPELCLDSGKKDICLAAIRTALRSLPSSYVAPSPHLQRYVDWMQRQPNFIREGELSTQGRMSQPLHQNHDFDAEGKLIVKDCTQSCRYITRFD